MLLFILLLVTVGVCALYIAPRMHAGTHTPELTDPTPDLFAPTVGTHLDVTL